MEVEVVKEFDFAAAHFLPGYKGKCANLHGHNYLLQIGVKGGVDNRTGMVMDFVLLKQLIEEQVIEVLDHHLLNGITKNNFPSEMPTVENMVIWLKNMLQPVLLPNISFIRLWETSTSYAEWRKN